jgi:chromosomal replication initiator protein
MEIVSKLREQLIDKVGKERYELWFGDHVRFERSESAICVVAQDAFSQERLRAKFAAEIRAAVCSVVGEAAAVEFIVCAPEPPSSSTASDASPSAPAPSSPPQRTADSSGQLRQQLFPFKPAPSPPIGAVGGRRRLATLEEFAVGDNNRVAHAAAHSVLARLGVVSPLFLYGPSGCGKTHLAEAIVQAGRTKGLRRAVFLSSEQFTSQFLEALQDSGLPNFRRKCRDADVLAIDDVQFLVGKKATLVEFQHTLDMLQRAGSQIVLTADRPPAELFGLGAEIITRMSSGLVCGIQLPEFETRLSIVTQLAQRREINLHADVLTLIATELLGDARQLSGALHRIHAGSTALGRSIDVEFARACLADLFRATKRIVRLADIQRAICTVFGMDARTLQTGGKARSVSHPRMLAMWLARKYTRAALSEIGQFFGQRSHTSVLAAQRKVDQLVAEQCTIRLDQHHCRVEDALRRVEDQLKIG